MGARVVQKSRPREGVALDSLRHTSRETNFTAKTTSKKHPAWAPDHRDSQLQNY